MVDLRAYGLAHALSVPEGARVGRVRTQHRIDWEMVTATGDVRAPLPNRKAERPGVGDWVVLAQDADVITAVLPRKNALVRRAAGLREEPQQLAANVDACFVLVPLSGPPNVKRIERYLALVLDGGSVPVIVLTKSDLCASIDEAIASVRTVSGDAAVHAISAQSGQGMAALEPYFGRRHGRAPRRERRRQVVARERVDGRGGPRHRRGAREGPEGPTHDDAPRALRPAGRRRGDRHARHARGRAVGRGRGRGRRLRGDRQPGGGVSVR
ncbi:MAG: GTPase RsgA [Myxococcales bacterium]|nr:GTPase RsgA [Myxococcales bacterium]